MTYREGYKDEAGKNMSLKVYGGYLDIRVRH